MQEFLWLSEIVCTGVHDFASGRSLSRRDTYAVLGDVGAYRVRTAHQWAETLISGDIDGFYDDGRGGQAQ